MINQSSRTHHLHPCGSVRSVAGEDYEVFDLFLVAAIHSFEECAESVTTDFCAAYFAYQLCNYGVVDVNIFLHLRPSDVES